MSEETKEPQSTIRPSAAEKEANAISHRGPDKGGEKGRRDLLLIAGAGLNVVAGALIAIPIVGYALSSFFRKPKDEWVSLGPTSQFPVGETRLATYQNPLKRSWDGETAQMPCWVRHTSEGDLQVFSIHCTHLGCPVRWFAESKLFMCPCHGGVYYEDGARASGPPPRGLYTYPHEVRDGALYIFAGEIPSLADPQA